MATERVALPPARARLLSRTGVVSVLLAGTLLVVVAVRIWIAGKIVTPWIFMDELVYSELAKSIASGDGLRIREVTADVPSVLYPAAIAPAWLVHGDVPAAYGLAKAINVLMMTSVVVPTYLWSRRLVPAVWALTACALVLVMPSMLYTSVLMSENAFFPLFVAACFAIAVALERPTVLRQALVFVPILLAVGVRVQAIVLLAVLPAAIVLRVLLDLCARDTVPRSRRAWRALRPFWPTFALLAAGTALFVAYETARGRGVRSALGSYDVVTSGGYSTDQVLHWLTLHFAELAFSVGIVPACALLVLVGVAVAGSATTAAERSFIAVATASVLLVVAQVAIFASRFSLRIEERYMFPLAPLLFIALVLWIVRGVERPLVVAVVAALIPVVLLLDLRLKSLLGVQILSDTFALIPVWRATQLLDGGVDTAQTLLWAGAAVAAAAFLFVPRRAAAILPVGVAAFLLLGSWPVYGAVRDYARNLQGYAGGSDLAWVDERIGADAHAPYLFDSSKIPGYDDMILWQTEFWNRSVGNVVSLGPPVRDPLVEDPGSIDPATGRIVAPGAAGARYAVATSGLALAGTPLASKSLLTLYRVSRPLRIARAVEGVYGDGWMGNHAVYSVYANGPKRVRVTLSREAWGGTDIPGHVTVRVGPSVVSGSGAAIGHVTAQRRLTLHKLERRTVTLPVPRAPYRVEVDITPTFSPAELTSSPDTRQLGAVVSFEQR